MATNTDFRVKNGLVVEQNASVLGNLTVTGTLSGALYVSGTGIVYNGSTSGSTTLRAAAVAGSTTVTMPATTGTLALTSDIIPITNGGTGSTTRQNAMDALAGAVTTGQYLRGNGTDVVMSAIQAADVPTLNQSTSGTAAIATTVTLTATDTTNASHYLTFVDTATGNENLRTDSTLAYNPAFNILYANGLYGVSASELQFFAYTNPLAGNYAGADVRVNGGTAKGTGTGGSASFRAGNGSTDQSSVGAGGNITMYAGSGSRNSDAVGSLMGKGGDGGSITITAGQTDSGGTAASIVLAGGKGAGTLPGNTSILASSAGGASNIVGGSLLLYGGAGSGAALGGPIVFYTSGVGSSGTTTNALTQRWQITAAGVLEANGAQTIQTSTGVLTLATAAGNGHIVMSPHGTGNFGIGINAPTGKLHTYINANAQLIFQNVSQNNLYVSGTNATVVVDSTGSNYPGFTIKTQGVINGQFTNIGGAATSGISLFNGGGQGLVIDGVGFVGINKAVPLARLQVEEMGLDTTTTTVAYGAGATEIYSASVAQFRTFEFMVQVTSSSLYHSVKIFALHDGTNVWFNQTNVLQTGVEAGTFNMDISGGNIRLLYTQASNLYPASIIVKVGAIKMAV